MAEYSCTCALHLLPTLHFQQWITYRKSNTRVKYRIVPQFYNRTALSSKSLRTSHLSKANALCHHYLWCRCQSSARAPQMYRRSAPNHYASNKFLNKWMNVYRKTVRNSKNDTTVRLDDKYTAIYIWRRYSNNLICWPAHSNWKHSIK